MTDTTSASSRELDQAQAFYNRQCDRIADKLRDLADTVERAKDPRSASWVDAATYVISDVHNTLPNLPVDVLVQAARDVDTTRGEHS